MTDPIAAKGLAKRFWEKKPLTKMSQDEWESLCDGCGKCCLNKLEDEDTEEVALTRVACRLLDDATCRCSHYENRYDWHPLISGDPDSVHRAGISVQHNTVSEFDTPFEEWEDHIIEEPT